MKQNIRKGNRPFQDDKHFEYSHTAFNFCSKEQAANYNAKVKYNAKSEAERILEEMRRSK